MIKEKSDVMFYVNLQPTHDRLKKIDICYDQK